MKKIGIVLVLIIFSFMVLPTRTNAVARTFGDLLDELDSLEAQKKEQQSQKAITQAEYNKTSNEIMAIEKKVNELNKEIVEATEKIKELTQEIENKKEETKNILVFLQVSNGEKTYLEYIFKAKSFTDLIHRISVVEQLTKYNDELISEMNALIKQNEELKIKLAKDIEEEEKERTTLQAKLRTIGSRIAELDEDAIGIDDLISGAKANIANYRKFGCTNRSDLLSSCMGIPTSTGFLRPISKGVVTSWYGYRTHPVTGQAQSFHSGVDLSDSSPAEGKDIYPVAAGVVAFTDRWSCGGNVLFIYHNINGVNYTSVYMHLLNINVKSGDVVTQSDIIGHMGGYSTSTSHGGYDTCTTGAHLHLTISRGHVTTANYRSSLIDPTSVIYLPSGWFYSRSW